MLRIDTPKIREIMPEDIRDRYDELRRQRDNIRAPKSLPSFLTVEEDAKRREEVRYVLNSGDAARPETERPVRPGLPLEPEGIDFREGHRETLAAWMTSKDNPLFARVAVNRLWQWHFGRPLHASPNDFGSLPEAPRPASRQLLDTLAALFVENDFDMKWLHKTIVLSETYQRASHLPNSEADASLSEHSQKQDPKNDLYWRFPLRRLEAEPVRDAILSLAGALDTTVGGPSFTESDDPLAAPSNRRAIYMKRGFRSSGNELPEFLETFDAEDGRESCPRREETVTAPQALWLMNNPLVDAAVKQFGTRLAKEAGDDLVHGIVTGYRMALGRQPDGDELEMALDYLQTQPHPERFTTLAWMLFNLDEFIYVR